MNQNIIDLNEPCQETIIDLNEPCQEAIEEGEQESEDINFEPFISQCFLSEEEAYLFYHKYVKLHGFSIRKARFDKNKDGKIRRRDFVCHREGLQHLKIVDPVMKQRNTASSRCGCKAHMRVKLKKSFDIFPEQWHVTEFSAEHNHEVLSQEEVRFLPSYRFMTKDDENRILLMKDGGLNVKQIMRIMELEKNVRHGHLSFTSKDVHNFFSKIRSEKSKNDVLDFFEYCKLAKEENANFQYCVTLDDERKVEHIFWSPAHCFTWYQLFRDVVAFDTTYKINAYDMPLGIFVGIDNHGRTILFGCALLRNETKSAFSWLMRTFVSLMKKPPKSILTDQDPWMTQAIAEEMPLTKHAFCIWHITSKFSSWFTGILRTSYFKWCSDFYNLYRLDTSDEFEDRWPQVIEKYNLGKNKHVLGLYNIRRSWVPAYLREHFFAGMTTTGRSESFNSFIKRFTSSRICLSQFIKQVDLAIEDIEQNQLQARMLEKYRGASLRTLSPLEEQAQNILTPFSFKKFQEEFGRATNYIVQQDYFGGYMVQHYTQGDTQKHAVGWNGQMLGCSCKNFEFWGIICRHILSVFLHQDMFTIPSSYFPLRWHSKILFDEDRVNLVDDTNGEGGLMDGVCEDINLGGPVHCPPKSKTKGRPKSKRTKGGKEVNMKQVKSCKYCNQKGHNSTTCPQKQKDEGNILCSQKSQKRKKNDAANESLNPIYHLKF